MSGALFLSQYSVLVHDSLIKNALADPLECVYGFTFAGKHAGAHGATAPWCLRIWARQAVQDKGDWLADGLRW